MHFETLIFEKKDKVGLLKINRPQALNALNKQVFSEFDAFLKSDTMKILTALVITGVDKSFVAGADLKEIQSLSVKEALELSSLGQAIFQRLENAEILTIAAVNGFALGGGLELALACDFILASDKAILGLPEVTLGLIPGYGGTQRLSRLVGKTLARRMILTGETFPAERALQWGLINEVIKNENLLDTALKIAKEATERTSPRAVYAAKKAINLGLETSSKEGYGLEAKLFSKLFDTQDFAEGVSAFIEKRPANFKNK